ncbi:MAG: PhzF family phenazine biosynthesis protein [Gemmatimonadota bacterium]|nr:PhzF family phenazine biosynthesis protein [Gemmatimonadota bacterium]
MKYKFVTADVFTDVKFGGNQLAVVLDARGLTSEQMQSIAREFNYSESVFVLPATDPSCTRTLRIFTPSDELPFAGHPTVGAAHVLAATGEIKLTGDETKIVFEEGIGHVPVTIRSTKGVPTFAQLSVAKLPEIGPPPPGRSALAELLSLEANDIGGGSNTPQAVSCGLPFLFVPVKDRAAVRRARVRMDIWDSALKQYFAPQVMVFARDPELPTSHIRARVFVPGLAVPEDPATGSAAAALGGYLGAREAQTDGTLRWVVEQGFEMGRPSILEIEVDKAAGEITAIRVGGASVLVMEGSIDAGDVVKSSAT